MLPPSKAGRGPMPIKRSSIPTEASVAACPGRPPALPSLPSSRSPNCDQGRKLLVPRPGLARLPVVDCHGGYTNQLRILLLAESQALSLGSHGSSGEADALQGFLGHLRFAQSLSLLGLQKADLFLLGLDQPFQLGDVTPILYDGLLGRTRLASISLRARRRISSFNAAARFGIGFLRNRTNDIITAFGNYSPETCNRPKWRSPTG